MEFDEHRVRDPKKLVQEAVARNGPEQDGHIKEAQPAKGEGRPLKLHLLEGGGGECHANDLIHCKPNSSCLG